MPTISRLLKKAHLQVACLHVLWQVRGEGQVVLAQGSLGGHPGSRFCIVVTCPLPCSLMVGVGAVGKDTGTPDTRRSSMQAGGDQGFKIVICIVPPKIIISQYCW